MRNMICITLTEFTGTKGIGSEVTVMLLTICSCIVKLIKQ